MSTAAVPKNGKKRKRLHECSVCLDVIDRAGDAAKTPCGHRFHLTCLMKSVHAGTWTCPLCRGDIIQLPKEEEEEENDPENDTLQLVREALPYIATLRLADDNFAKLKASVESMCVIFFISVYLVPFVLLSLMKILV